jgi:hypothetical protein
MDAYQHLHKDNNNFKYIIVMLFGISHCVHIPFSLCDGVCIVCHDI